jgi:hypothetical protein
MVEKLLEGFSWGIMVVGGLIPVAAFAVAWSWLGPKLKKPEEDLALLDTMFEKPPEMPEHEEPQIFKYTPSTIVRPPNVVQLADVKKTKGNGDDK